MAYKDLCKKYSISKAEGQMYELVERKRAFWDLDAEIECYQENGRSEWNDGDPLDPTDEEIERIIDEYLERRHADSAASFEVEDMRNAIQSVTGVIC